MPVTSEPKKRMTAPARRQQLLDVTPIISEEGFAAVSVESQLPAEPASRAPSSTSTSGTYPDC